MLQRSILLDGESLITPSSMSSALAADDVVIDERQKSAAFGELALILNLAQQQFENGANPQAAVHRLAGALHETRRKLHPRLWQELIPVAQSHPVSRYLLEDPFTRWSHDKPRGYSGDAQLLDFIYGHPSIAKAVADSSEVGQALYAYTKDASSSVAVRERRNLLTKYVDEIAASKGPDTEVLAIAAGHLREANQSKALWSQGIRRWVALDQDPLSVGSITRDFAGTCIEAVDGSVRSILAKPDRLGRFDFVYAAGLYDYLSHKVSVRLTRACLQMLKPGGTFLFANFSEDIGVDGYMETFMNWALLLRSEADMWSIIEESRDPGDKASVMFGANRNIVYGLITRGS